MDKKRYAGVVVKCNDKVLLAKRNNLGSYPGMWSIFGGRVEEGEDTRDAAKRELTEEILQPSVLLRSIFLFFRKLTDQQFSQEVKLSLWELSLSVSDTMSRE